MKINVVLANNGEGEGATSRIFILRHSSPELSTSVMQVLFSFTSLFVSVFKFNETSAEKNAHPFISVVASSGPIIVRACVTMMTSNR